MRYGARRVVIAVGPLLEQAGEPLPDAVRVVDLVAPSETFRPGRGAARWQYRAAPSTVRQWMGVRDAAEVLVAPIAAPEVGEAAAAGAVPEIVRSRRGVIEVHDPARLGAARWRGPVALRGAQRTGAAGDHRPPGRGRGGEQSPGGPPAPRRAPRPADRAAQPARLPAGRRGPGPARQGCGRPRLLRARSTRSTARSGTPAARSSWPWRPGVSRRSVRARAPPRWRPGRDWRRGSRATPTRSSSPASTRRPPTASAEEMREQLVRPFVVEGIPFEAPVLVGVAAAGVPGLAGEADGAVLALAAARARRHRARPPPGSGANRSGATNRAWGSGRTAGSP